MLPVSLGLHQYSHILLDIHMVFLQTLELHHLHFLKLDVFHKKAVMSSDERTPLDILFVSCFNTPFTLPVFIIVMKLFDSSTIPFGPLMWSRRLCIVTSSNIISSVSQLFHESKRRWSALVWSFDFDVFPGF